MSYGGAFPHIKCIAPGGTTKGMVQEALYAQNAHCTKCSAPFIDDDVCCWDRIRRVEHVNCENPMDPGEILIRAAEERVKRAQSKT